MISSSHKYLRTREQQNAGEGGFGGVKLTPFVNTIIRVRVTFGEHHGELKGMGPGTGSRAAKDAADGLLKWIERNRADRPPHSLTAMAFVRPAA
jgi:hypothetical protein